MARALSEQALFAAKLLAGDMPQDIEKLFLEAGLSLFPEKLQDLTTDCSCPDWSNPCKHIAAVYYLLGEEFDRDPFLIFKLRGSSREELLQLSAEAGAREERKKSKGKIVADKIETAEPLPADPSSFWSGGSLPDDFFGEVRKPPVSAALPKRLGSFPFWRGEEPFLRAMEEIYRRAAQYGLDVFLGEGSASKPADPGTLS